jgi:hypothetical protein
MERPDGTEQGAQSKDTGQSKRTREEALFEQMEKESRVAFYRQIQAFLGKLEYTCIAKVREQQRYTLLIERLQHVTLLTNYSIYKAVMNQPISNYQNIEHIQNIQQIQSIERNQNIERIQKLSKEDATQRLDQQLQDFIPTEDSLSRAKEASNPSIDINLIHRLNIWLQESTQQSSRLWIECPFEIQEESAAWATALGVVQKASDAKIPFIAHFCETDNRSRKSKLLSLVYDFIAQFITMSPSTWDDLSVSRKRLYTLSENPEDWDSALKLLKYILRHFPQVECFCIIHGFNNLDGGRSKRSEDLLEVLLAHSNLRILFTTSGMCDSLSKAIPIKERASSEADIREVNSTGMSWDSLQI